MRDPYEVLQLDISATPSDVKAAYRRLSKTLHPDAGGGRAQFDELREAYRILSDPELRQRYDLTGTLLEPYKVEEKVRGELASMVQGFLASEEDVDTTNVMEKMHEMVQYKLDGLHNQNIECGKLKKRASRIAKRFKAKTGVVNIGKEVMLHNIKLLNDKVAENNDKIKALKAVQEYLNLLDYEFVEPIPFGSMLNGG